MLQGVSDTITYYEAILLELVFVRSGSFSVSKTLLTQTFRLSLMIDALCTATVQVGGSNVEVVDTFTYLGCQLHSSGGSEHEVNRRISISRNCNTVCRCWTGTLGGP